MMNTTAEQINGFDKKGIYFWSDSHKVLDWQVIQGEEGIYAKSHRRAKRKLTKRKQSSSTTKEHFRLVDANRGENQPFDIDNAH